MVAVVAVSNVSGAFILVGGRVVEGASAGGVCPEADTPEVPARVATCNAVGANARSTRGAAGILCADC